MLALWNNFQSDCVINRSYIATRDVHSQLLKLNDIPEIQAANSYVLVLNKIQGAESLESLAIAAWNYFTGMPCFKVLFKPNFLLHLLYTTHLCGVQLEFNA